MRPAAAPEESTLDDFDEDFGDDFGEDFGNDDSFDDLPSGSLNFDDEPPPPDWLDDSGPSWLEEEFGDE